MNCRPYSTPPPGRTSWWRNLLALAFLGLLSLPGDAQVNYSFNFDLNATGWTGNYARFTNATACGGAGSSMRHNLYGSATTNQLISPLTGSSIGGVCTIGYTYKCAVWSANTAGAPTPWGNFAVQYGATASGPWTTITTVTNEAQTGSCLPKSHNFSPPAGALYIRFAGTWTGGDYYMNFDNITITEVAAPCAGVPNPGNTTGPAMAMLGQSFNVGLQNATPGTGVTYAWEYNNGGGWTSFGTNAPSQSTTLVGGVATSYRCTVTCAGSPTTSNPITVAVDPTIQVGGGTNTYSYLPIYSCYVYNYSQQIYEGSEITTAGGSAGMINKIKFYYTGGATFGNWTNWTVWLGNTGLTGLASTSSWIPSGSLTQVFSGSITEPAINTWMELTLSTPFVYTGGNLAVAVYENTPGYYCTAQWGSFEATAPPGGAYRSMVFWSDGTNPNPSAPPAASTPSTTTRARIQMSILPATPCTGTPAPGTVTGPSLVASGGSVNLGLSNTFETTGISYQWYVSTTNASGPWSPVGGNSPSLSATVGSESWYYCAVTCAEGPSTGNSNVHHVGIIPILLVPAAGSNTNPCGTNVILQDHAGSGVYNNNVEGYTVLEAGLSSTISISGS